VGIITPTRDFTFVLDTVEGFIKFAECDKVLGEVVNIGSNFEISIGDLIEKIKNLMNSDIRVEIDEQRIRPDKSEVNRLFADITKAKEMLGWQPQYSLDDGPKITIDWFSDKENLKNYKSGIYNV